MTFSTFYLNSKHQRLCNGKCIEEREPCNYECEKNGSYPIFCQEENQCKGIYEPCSGKCLNKEKTIISYEIGQTIVVTVCKAENECIPEGPIFGGAFHMCNGICLPVFIPCNNTCIGSVLFRTNRRAPLSGPLNCEEISSNLNKTLVEETFGNEGYCLPGSISCNGTCTIDSRIPLKVSI